MASSELFCCSNCLQEFKTNQGLASHMRQKTACREVFEMRLEEKASQLLARLGRSIDAPGEDLPPTEEEHEAMSSSDPPDPHPIAPPFPMQNYEPEPLDEPSLSSVEPPSKRARVEDLPEDDGCDAGGLLHDPYVRAFHGAAATHGKCHNLYEKLRDARTKEGLGDNPWAPFQSEDEWKLACFILTSGMSHGDIDKYLKLNIVRT